MKNRLYFPNYSTLIQTLPGKSMYFLKAYKNVY